MKKRFIGYETAIIAASGMIWATPGPQQQVSFTEGAGGTWNADWSGVSARTYFLQWSLDLVNWHYAPLVEFGAGLKSFGVNTQGESKFFLRLRYVDDTAVTDLSEAREADFDNDGIPSWYEVEVLGTDPLDRHSAGGDSDSNTLPDGWELYHFGGLGIADPGEALQPDGLTNKDKADLGLDPNTDYSAPNASQTAIYSYDAAGRLTGVTAPVGTGTYVSDQEGNLINAQ